eukprot:COSAG02_NODE_55468_length_290_cov_1.062827_2_plen_67_part_01
MPNVSCRYRSCARPEYLRGLPVIWRQVFSVRKIVSYLSSGIAAQVHGAVNRHYVLRQHDGLVVPMEW